MFWADTLLENRTGKEIINDSWTPSGIVHMGSLKGPVIHDVFYRILKEKNADVTFMYGFDDMDPIDGLPSNLLESHKKYLGVPIYKSPSPDGNGSFGDFFSNKMQHLLGSLDIHPEIYRTSELYQNGTFNKAIRFVLDNAAAIRKVYGDMYKKKIPDDWFPLQVICPNCGKVGTTKVTGWDGKEVNFCCEKDLVQWAEGCGICGKTSPFDGKSKMPWKVEWAAKWWTFGVTIEGAGKDHGSAGGSYDVAMQICKDVFEKEQPLKLVYEFFLSTGKKMSSSKGLGLTGEDLLEVVGPQRARFLMVKTPPNQAVEFTPHNTYAIPKLFDDYQQVAFSREKDAKRIFELSQVDNVAEKIPSVTLMTLTQWIQWPNKREDIKKEGLEIWVPYARTWNEKYAPKELDYSFKENIEDKIENISDKSKQFLAKVRTEIDNYKDDQAEEFQKALYEWAKAVGISSTEAFQAIYLSLIGRDHGPKAAWLILWGDREGVKKRFKDVSEAEEKKEQSSTLVKNLNKPEVFSIGKEVGEKFPSISVGVAIIRDVAIKQLDEGLEEEKNMLLTTLAGLTTEELGKYKEVISYRKLYKETGVDWHSRRPSPEALLRRAALKKGLYTINTCVDAYNLVVMKHRVSIGAFDLDVIKLPTVLRFAKTDEEILLLGDDQPTKYKDGEIAYFDRTGGFNIDFNYRDAKRSAVGLSTKNLYINVDGVYDITPERVEKILQEACEIIMKYCGGKLDLFGVEAA